MNNITHPGMIAPTMDISHIGRRECQSPGVWYRVDKHMTLYCLHKNDITPCVLKADLDSICYLCRAGEPHTELLHDNLIWTPHEEQQHKYAERY